MRTRATTGGAPSQDRVVAALLTAVCRDEVTPELAARASQQAVVTAARHHRIAPLAHVRLRDVAPAVAQVLRPDRDAAMAMHIRTAMLLAMIDDTLAEIPWVAFKGPVLAELSHPVPGLRRYGDLDLLVAPESLREVARRLLAAGWRVGDYEDMLRNPAVPGEMHWFTPTGVPVDLHWSMVNMAANRRLFTIPTAELLAHRARAQIGMASVWTLDAADEMVHVALHAALTGGNRLGWVLDVDQVARRVTDWEEAARRARRWGAEAQVALMLRRATATLGTPVPAGVYRALGRSPLFHAVVDLVDRAAPVARHRRDASVSRLVARAVRRGTVATLASVARSGAQWAVEKVRPAPAPPDDRVRADAAALDHYLDAVERVSVSRTATAAGAQDG